MNISNLLPPPTKPLNLPSSIKWLAGEGGGSWFHIERYQESFLIKRYSPIGKLECAGNFMQTSGVDFQENNEYVYTFLSHCAKVTIIQNEHLLQFKLIDKI